MKWNTNVLIELLVGPTSCTSRLSILFSTVNLPQKVKYSGEDIIPSANTVFNNFTHV